MTTTDPDGDSRRRFLKRGGLLATAGLLAGCNGLVGDSGDTTSNDGNATSETTSNTDGSASTTASGTAGSTDATTERVGSTNATSNVTGTARTTTPGDTTHTSPDLAKFVADLTVPDTMKPAGKKDGHPHYEVMMKETTRSFHPDLGDTTIWGYEGQFPGPTFEIERGQTISVHWANDELPDEHLFPVDESLPAQQGNPKVRSVVHLHGSNANSISDGFPEAWYTPDGETTGAYYAGETYTYQNHQPPTTLWYHDHVLGQNRLNVHAGLAGLYYIRGDVGGTDGLPSGEYDIPLVLQDRKFNDDGSAYYRAPELGGIDPSVIEMFFGDVATVNGTAWPRLEVEPRKYRFRLLNASNARTYKLALEDYDEDSGERTGEDGPGFVQVARDGGYLNEPVALHDRLLLGPAQRGQWVVDFSEHAGESLLLHNDARAPYRGGNPSRADQEPLPEIMLFDVQSGDTTDDSTLPESFGPLSRLGDTSKTGTKPVPTIEEDDAVAHRTLTLNEVTDQYDRVMLLLDGLRYADDTTERPTVDTTEVWHLVNVTDAAHPIHVHLVQFQVLDRQSFDIARFKDSGMVSPTGEIRGPSKEEQGWVDTVIAPPGDVTSIVAHFGEFDGLFRSITGRYVWHCHMLEHANHEMIRPMEVDPEGYTQE